jgi:fructose transport system permease protein
MATSTTQPVAAGTLTRFNRSAALLGRVVMTPTFGPLAVLIAFCAVFALSTRTFLAGGNLSIVVQQSVIIGTLAIGQTMIILTAGIDLTLALHTHRHLGDGPGLPGFAAGIAGARLDQ